MMRKIACLSLLLAACSSPPSATEQPTANSDLPAGSAMPSPSTAPPQAPPGGNVVAEAPFSATSAQGAADVVHTYFALIEAGNYVEAHKLWGSASDLADGTFADQFKAYREYHAEVLPPGEIQGAAGSLYVEVPVRTYGVTAKGERFEEPNVVTLRRVNDVDGSTAEQRRWHIARIDRPPATH